MGTIELLSLFSRWVHLLSVVVAIGGAVFMRFILMPAAHAALPDDAHEKLRAPLMARWRRVVHTCVALLLVTGGINFAMAFHDGVKPIPYHPIFGVKLILALVVFFLAIVLAGSSPGFAGLRARRAWWMSVLITLAVVVILLSGILKLIHQSASADAGPAAETGVASRHDAG